MQGEFHQPEKLVLSWAPHLVPSFNYHHIVLKPFQTFGRQRDRNHLGRGTTKKQNKTPHLRQSINILLFNKHLLKAYLLCTVVGAEDIKIKPTLYPQSQAIALFRDKHIKAKFIKA